MTDAMTDKAFVLEKYPDAVAEKNIFPKAWTILSHQTWWERRSNGKETY
jgi:hypothetical protein